jgi:hypothetical protein
MKEEKPKVSFLWFGKPDYELTREELYKVIEFLQKELERVQNSSNEIISLMKR